MYIFRGAKSINAIRIIGIAILNMNLFFGLCSSVLAIMKFFET
jgi:hypothetical protein